MFIDLVVVQEKSMSLRVFQKVASSAIFLGSLDTLSVAQVCIPSKVLGKRELVYFLLDRVIRFLIMRFPIF